MQLAGDGQAVFEAAENHVENNTEGAMESLDRIGKSTLMPVDGGDDPRMGQLEKKRTASAEEDRSFAVNAPDC